MTPLMDVSIMQPGGTYVSYTLPKKSAGCSFDMEIHDFADMVTHLQDRDRKLSYVEARRICVKLVDHVAKNPRDTCATRKLQDKIAAAKAHRDNKHTPKFTGARNYSPPASYKRPGFKLQTHFLVDEQDGPFLKVIQVHKGSRAEAIAESESFLRGLRANVKGTDIASVVMATNIEPIEDVAYKAEWTRGWSYY